MKKIYFVRHAESEGNVGTVRQGALTPLSDKGKQQIDLIAERCKKLAFDQIISSPQTRAKNTAEAIHKATHKPISINDLLIERKRPSMFEGKSKDDPDALAADQEMIKRFHEADWRHSDEENFLDLKQRAQQFLAYLETLSDEHLLIVTHGVFLRMIAAVIFFGEELTSREYWNFYVTLIHENTGITVFEKIEYGNEAPRWRLITWNDHAHLG